MGKFPLYFQLDGMDCGPTCVRMISDFYGKKYSLSYLRENSFIVKTGVSLLGLSQLADSIGFSSSSVMLTVDDLLEFKPFPCILHWDKIHFVVLWKVSTSVFSKKLIFHIADPAHGHIKLPLEKFKESWISESDSGVALILEPTPEFYKAVPKNQKGVSIGYLLEYLKPYKKRLARLFILLFFGSAITLALPFFTQALIDKGIGEKDLNFIFIILLAQLSLFLGSIVIEVLRNWTMLYIGTRLGITIISDFLQKMLMLPIKFFDSKLLGDFQQRIQDNERIEQFLTSQSLLTLFSLITFSVFFGVLWYYNFMILVIYLLLTVASIVWSFFWLKKRKNLDYFIFQERSKNQEAIYELLNGVVELKLNQLEDYKINNWKFIQEKLFKLNLRILKIDQIQLSGFEFFNQVKNIVVIFYASVLVVKGSLTLGMLLSISYIIGQMNSPVSQFLNFIRSLQFAKLSLERLNEVQNQDAEEHSDQLNLTFGDNGINNYENKENGVKQRGIELKDLSFQYEGPKSPFVLRNVNLLIKKGEVTAIIGASGSGKTTLMKLLLKFYDPSEGTIYFDGINSLKISPKSIRENTGAVMQDGYLFSDSIERNIAASDKVIDEDRLKKACHIANIEDFVSSLPQGYKTKIGSAGVGLSGGQKQRILIARAVYKDPKIILLDEATSALDAENENIIHTNLKKFFIGKTVVVIAHRMSTVKNADKIVVLKDGRIVEIGNHHELIELQNEYFNLIKNQLELGS